MTTAERKAWEAKLGNSPPKAPNVPATPRTPPKPNTEKAEPVALNQRLINQQRDKEQKRDAVPRPRFALTEHEQYGGFRFVAHSINAEQAEALCLAAEKAGIQEQN